MTKFHVAVIGARPVKGSDGKYLPTPKENVEFVKKVLSLVDDGNYASLAHGAAENTIDDVVDDYGYEHNIRTKQFPAYWFNPTRPNNVDKAAGLFRNEQMVRWLSNAIYNTTDQAVLLLFHTTENPWDDGALKSISEFVTKRNENGKYGKVTIRTFQLPVTVAPKVSSIQLSLTDDTATMPDPFHL